MSSGGRQGPSVSAPPAFAPPLPASAPPTPPKVPPRPPLLALGAPPPETPALVPADAMLPPLAGMPPLAVPPVARPPEPAAEGAGSPFAAELHANDRPMMAITLAANTKGLQMA